MKIEELARPDLAYISCGICGDAWQDPPPPALPSLPADGALPAVGYLEAVDLHARYLAGDPELAAHAAIDGLVERWETVIRDREIQGITYRVSDAAAAASRDHAEQAHTLDDHLAHAHGNQIPLACEKCGHQEQATQEGLAHLNAHDCAGRRAACPTCASFAEGSGLRPGEHIKAYPPAS